MSWWNWVVRDWVYCMMKQFQFREAGNMWQAVHWEVAPPPLNARMRTHTELFSVCNYKNCYISDVLRFWWGENTWPFGEESMEDNGKDIRTDSTTAISLSSSNGGSVSGFTGTIFICGELFIITVFISYTWRCEVNLLYYVEPGVKFCHIV